MEKNNKNLIELLTRKRYVNRNVMLPVSIFVRFERLYYLIAVNYLTYNEFWKLIFGFAQELIDEIVFKYKVKRFFKILNIIERIKFLLHDFINYVIYKKPLMLLADFPAIKEEFEKLNMSDKDIEMFIKWMDTQHCKYFKNDLFIKKEKFLDYLVKFCDIKKEEKNDK